MPTDDFNLYAAPRALDPVEAATIVPDEEAEAFRRDHLGREAEIKAFGILGMIPAAVAASYGFLICGFVIVVTVGKAIRRPIPLTGQARLNAEPINLLIMLAGGFVFFGLAAIQYVLSRNLRRLLGSARWLSIVLLSIPTSALIFFGVAAMIAGRRLDELGSILIPAAFGVLIVLRLASGTSARVCSAEYRAILPRTARLDGEVRRRTWKTVAGIVGAAILVTAVCSALP